MMIHGNGILEQYYTLKSYTKKRKTSAPSSVIQESSLRYLKTVKILLATAKIQNQHLVQGMRYLRPRETIHVNTYTWVRPQTWQSTRFKYLFSLVHQLASIVGNILLLLYSTCSARLCFLIYLIWGTTWFYTKTCKRRSVQYMQKALGREDTW